MTTEKMNNKLIHYFDTYKESKECFVTIDNTIFHNENDAVSHAESLKDKTVASFDRAYAQKLKEQKGGSDEPKPFSKMNKAELKAACKERAIDFDKNATNADLVAALEEFEQTNIQVVVTKEMLEENTDLDAEVGDTIWIPKEEE